MCGIVGFAGCIESRLLNQLIQIQQHRGADDSGECRDPDN